MNAPTHFRVTFETGIRANHIPDGWDKRLVHFWTEDECLRRDPSAEHLPDAWYRITGERFGLATEIARVDNGDSWNVLYEGGWVVTHSFDGDSLSRVAKLRIIA